MDKAVILAGGLGTRLIPVTLEIPKPLIPVQGRSLTEHTLDVLKKAGIKEATLAVGYKAEQIMDYFKNKDVGVKLSYIVEKGLVGTGGWMKMTDRIKDDFIVVNGDNLFAIDFNELLKFHKKHNAMITIALKHVEDTSRYGVVKLEGDKIIEFVEKPKKEEAPSHYINSGYYIFNEEIFDNLPDKKSFMLEKDVFPAIAKMGRLYGYKSDALWFDTGTFESWERVIKEWKF